MEYTLKDIRKYAGEDMADEFVEDLIGQLIAAKDSYYRGEHEKQCTCAPPHKFQVREARCPRYVESLESALRDVSSILADVHANDQTCRFKGATPEDIGCSACIAQTRIADALPHEIEPIIQLSS